jgi:hypothetical protein
MTRTWTRSRAGLYETVLADGEIAQVENMTTGYGDSGWVWWCDGNRSDFPVDTRRHATWLLEQYIAKQRRGRPLIEVLAEDE